MWIYSKDELISLIRKDKTKKKEGEHEKQNHRKENKMMKGKRYLLTRIKKLARISAY